MSSETKDTKGFWGSTLDKLKQALSKTKNTLGEETTLVESEQDLIEVSSPSAVPSSEPEPLPEVPAPAKTPHTVKVDEEYLEDLEDRLIRTDMGLSNVDELMKHVRTRCRNTNMNSHDLASVLKDEFVSILSTAPKSDLQYTPGKLNIYFVVGVNGTGKTTSIGKLCWRFKQEGKKVLMAAGDTFRAAAETQLEIWAGRAGVDIVRLEDKADPGAVVFKAVEKARNENYDCLVIDTAGRLHNKANLMAELKKVRGVIDKHASDLPLEALLVLDASTGQNGLQQAKVFGEVCSLSGVILTKLDGTAKGGIVFSIAKDLGIPVKLIGLGEKMEDLRDFEPKLFVEALLA